MAPFDIPCSGDFVPRLSLSRHSVDIYPVFNRFRLDETTTFMRSKQTYFKHWTTLVALLVGVLSAKAAVIDVTTPLPRGEVRWTSDNTYILNGLVHALSDTDLHIEAGTVIKGRNIGPDAVQQGGLVICRGARIFAEGTPKHPIIMTAEEDDVNDPFDLDIYDRGLWGGLVIMGRAILNGAADSAGNASNPIHEVYEGLPDIAIEGEFVHRFGGTDDDDDSGILRYLSIRHGGARIEQNKEINGLTMGAVGRGTTIEFVEAYAIADDAFEWFGGTVNTRYLVAAFCDDDHFDCDQGYRGKNQFWFSIQAPDLKNYGFELNGEVNGTTGDLPREPFSTFEVYNVTSIGAGLGNQAGGEDNDTFRIREFSSPRIFNGIFTEFARRGIRIDGKSDFFLQNGSLRFENNLWWNFGNEAGDLDNSMENIAVDERAQVLFTDEARKNWIMDPELRGISRDADGGLDPRPAPGSPALVMGNVKQPPQDGFYTPVDYIGAFGTNDLWLNHWTAVYQYGIITPNGEDLPGNVVEVTTPLPRGEIVWSRTNTYVLNGLVHALSGTDLHIEAGTIIKGRNIGPDAVQQGGLVICRGARIFAMGTAQNPIIMTAEEDDVNDPFDLDIYDRGLWGGLVIMGRAILNGAADSAGNASNPIHEVYEGLPDIAIEGEFVHRFGGTDDDDDSGILRYLSIRHGGARIEQNKEINGLTMGAVGRGTTIEFVEAYAIADDAFEWFGGTVNTRYLVAAFCDDDHFDCDQGYRGKNQFWFSIQAPDLKNYGFELNGEVNGTTGDLPREPFSTFEVYNVTSIGAGLGNQAGGEDNDTFRIREFSSPRIFNGIFTEFARRGIRIDGKSDFFLQNGSLRFENNLWWNFGNEAGDLDNSMENIAVDERAQVLFTDQARKNWIMDPELRGISRDADAGLDPRPTLGSPALVMGNVKQPAQDGFYTPVHYIGAFGDMNWAADWTALSEYRVLTAVGGGNPVPPAMSTGEPTTLSIGMGVDGQIQLIWTEGTLESSDSIHGPFEPVADAASPFQVMPEGSGKFYRLQ